MHHAKVAISLERTEVIVKFRILDVEVPANIDGEAEVDHVAQERLQHLFRGRET